MIMPFVPFSLADRKNQARNKLETFHEKKLSHEYAIKTENWARTFEFLGNPKISKPDPTLLDVTLCEYQNSHLNVLVW